MICISLISSPFCLRMEQKKVEAHTHTTSLKMADSYLFTFLNQSGIDRIVRTMLNKGLGEGVTR
jgi:hypothetical protein